MHSPNLSLPPGEMSRQRQRGLGSFFEGAGFAAGKD